MLSCECDYNDDGPYYYSNDFILFDRKRRKRCCSCSKLINQGDPCVIFTRYRGTRTDIEERIYGDEIRLADWFMCEWCGEMCLNLSDFGYCMFLGDSMKENMEDYWKMTGFKPQNHGRSGVQNHG